MFRPRRTLRDTKQWSTCQVRMHPCGNPGLGFTRGSHQRGGGRSAKSWMIALCNLCLPHSTATLKSLHLELIGSLPHDQGPGGMGIDYRCVTPSLTGHGGIVDGKIRHRARDSNRRCPRSMRCFTLKREASLRRFPSMCRRSVTIGY